MTHHSSDDDGHSERAIEAMGAYMVDALHDVPSLKFDTAQHAQLMAGYMQGAATIQAAEIMAKALDRLTAAIALSANPVRGTA